MTLDQIPDDAGARRFAFHQPPFWTRGLALVLGGLAFLTLSVVAQSESGGFRSLIELLMAGGAFLVLAGIVVGFRLLRLPKQPPAIEIAAGKIRLPLSARSSSTTELTLEELLWVELRQRELSALLILDSTHRTFVYRSEEFQDPADILRCRDLLIAELGQRLDPELLADRFREREDSFEAAVHQPTRVTTGLALALGLVFLVELATGALDSELKMLVLGASSPTLVRGGEYYRLITSTFLHGGLLHLVMNLLALVTFGGLVERVIGPWRYSLIYMVSGVAGGIGSVILARGLVSVGASGCIFGLLGGYGVISLLHQSKLPSGFRLSRRWWGVILLLNAGLPVLFPMIDWAAHLGGLLGGAAVAFIIGRSPEAINTKYPVSMALRISTALFAAVWLAASAVGIEQAATQSMPDLQELAQNPDTGPEFLNQMAWNLALDEDVPRSSLHEAKRLAETAVERSGGSLAIRDTLAQVLHRLGQDAEAAALEARVLAEVPQDPSIAPNQRPKAERIYASQLARFLVRLPTQASPTKDTPPEGQAPPLGPKVQVTSSPKGIRVERLPSLPGEAVVPPLPSPPPQTASQKTGPAAAAPSLADTVEVLHYLVLEEGKTVGLLRLCVASNAKLPGERLPRGSPKGGWPEGVDLQFKLSAQLPCDTGTAGSGWSISYWPHDPIVDTYP